MFSPPTTASNSPFESTTSLSSLSHDLIPSPDSGLGLPGFDSLEGGPINTAESARVKAQVPRKYQEEIIEQARTRNVIAVCPTGSGKTLVAMKLLEEICKMTEEKGDGTKLAFFLVPSVPLVSQQCDNIRQETSLKVKMFSGSDGAPLWEMGRWMQQLDIANTQVVVCTPQILLNVLQHAYIKMEQLSVVVFDEVHHCRKNHPYSVFFKNHYHRQVPSNTRPKILGLTASPIWDVRRPQKSLDELQSTTTCRVIAVKEHGSELEEHAPKPSEMIAYYTPPEKALDRSEFAAQLSLLWAELKVGKLDWEKVEVKARKAMDVLGPLGEDYYLVSQYEKPVNDEVKLGKIMIGGEEERKLPKLKWLKALIHCRIGDFPPTIQSGMVTAKVGTLISVLEQHYSNAQASAASAMEDGGMAVDSGGDQNFQCIIFVQERHVAFSLAWILERAQGLQGWIKVRTLVGHGGNQRRNGEHGLDFRHQSTLVKDFKAGEFNVLISTSVGEEGLDFPACDLVVRFDVFQTMISYVQSRGRARHRTSKYIVLVNESNPQEREMFEKFSAMEPQLKEAYKTERAADVEIEMSNLTSHDNDLRSVFTVPTTGACLTYEDCIQLCHQVCNLLPTTAGLPPPKPFFETYNSIQEGVISRFACDVILPSATCIPLAELKIRGTARSTKAEAKRAVAFEACKVLHKYKLLDDHLLPHREVQEEKQQPAIDDPWKVKTDVEEMIDVTVEATWANLWNSSTAYVHPVTIDGQSLVGIVSAKPLAYQKVFDLWAGVAGDTKTEVSIGVAFPLMPTPGSSLRDDLVRLDGWTRDVLSRILRPQFRTDKPFACLFAPLLRERQRPGIAEISVDWDAVRHIFEMVSWDSFRPETDVAFDPYWRPLRVEAFRPDLNPESVPVWVPQDDGSQECREQGFSNYYVYSKVNFMRPGNTSLAEVPSLEDKTMLQVKILERRRNNLVPRNADQRLEKIALTLERQKATTRIIIIRSFMKFSKMSIAMYQSLLLMPSVLRFVQDHERLSKGQIRLGLQAIPYSLLHEAQTPPAAMYGRDYQRLETLGDSVLKLCTTIHTYNHFPLKHEGFLSVIRANAVSNKFLRTHANDAGMGAMMIMEPVVVTKWEPPSFEARTDDGLREKRTINRKWLQDTTEATLGACYLSGGIPLALAFGTKLDLVFGGTESWTSRYGGPRKKLDVKIGKNLAELEDKLGYKFRDPRLLLEAVTHPSTLGTESAPYQRLEYLGDAVLDFIVIKRVFEENPHAPPGLLTHLKQSMVANAPLSMLSANFLELHRFLIHSSSALDQQIIKGVAMFKDKTPKEVLARNWSYNPPKFMSDLVESCIGAMFIDCGWDLDVVTHYVMPLLTPLFDNVKYAPEIDPVGEVYRWVQREFNCVDTIAQATRVAEASATGPGQFAVEFKVHGKVIARASDNDKQTAKCLASETAHRKLLKSGEMRVLCDCKAKKMDVDGEEESRDLLDLDVAGLANMSGSASAWGQILAAGGSRMELPESGVPAPLIVF